MSLADYSDHRDDLGLIKVLGVRPNNDLYRRAVLLVLLKKETDFLRDLLDIQFSICRACEHFPFLLSAADTKKAACLFGQAAVSASIAAFYLVMAMAAISSHSAP